MCVRDMTHVCKSHVREITHVWYLQEDEDEEDDDFAGEASGSAFGSDEEESSDDYSEASEDDSDGDESEELSSEGVYSCIIAVSVGEPLNTN